MESFTSRTSTGALLLTVCLLLSSSAVASTQKKNTNPPPKPAPAAHPAARPAARPATKPAANRYGPATNRTAPRVNGGPSPRISPRPAAPRMGPGGRPEPRGVRTTPLPGGGAIQRRPNGKISDIHDARHGLDIHHGLNGVRRVSIERPDHSRVFAERGRPGYIQHPYAFRGHDFARRSYYWHGRAYNRFYREYHYRGALVEVYAPTHYWRAGFYGWTYNPWYHPVAYAWGWGAAPWVGYYGFYFTPYATYPSAPYWLTDYMISQDLAADYAAAQEAQTEGAAPAEGAAAELTPEVKQQIASEVSYQIALENSEAQQNTQNQDSDPGSSGIARLLADGHSHIFVAGDDLDAVDASGNECALSGGDVLELATAPPPDAQAADLVVLASKGGSECPKTDTVTIAFGDLQEMQNHMRETIDQGLETLQSQQGTNGLPPAPPTAQGAPVQTAFAQLAPPPDPNGAADISQTEQQASQTEQEVTTEAQQPNDAPPPPDASMPAPASPAPPTSAPVTVSLGQTFDQVTNALGQPVRIIDLGSKKIYQYRDMKVTFVGGKVTNVE